MDNRPILLVTGCTGYLGAWCTKKAVESGKYQVRGTTRNPNSNRAKKLQELCSGLELVACELMKDDGWADAFKDVTFLLHTASPFNLDPKMDFVTPAVEGTKRVLGFAEQSGTVRKVVLTSSCAAVSFGLPPWKLEEREYSDQDWSSFPDDCTNYEASKTFAEKYAWEWSKKTGIWMCTVNPGLIVGHSVLGVAGGTLDAWKAFYEAGYGPPVKIPICEVQDIAEIHVNALDRDGAEGKRLIMADCAWVCDLFEKVAEEFNPMGYAFPNKPMPGCLLCCFFNCCCCCNPLAEMGPSLNKDFTFNRKLATQFTDSGKPRNWAEASVDMTYDFIESGALPKKPGYKPRQS